jgi:hypothetical protein
MELIAENACSSAQSAAPAIDVTSIQLDIGAGAG